MIALLCQPRYPTPPLHPEGPRGMWVHILHVDDSLVPYRQYLPPGTSEDPTGMPVEMIEATRLASQLKEASAMEGIQLAHKCFS